MSNYRVWFPGENICIYKLNQTSKISFLNSGYKPVELKRHR
jgi:hypothetical protein